MIKITSKKHLFRRAGIAHPKGTVEYPDGKFTKEQLATLQAEPMLAVEVIEEAGAMTVAEIKAKLDELKIVYPANAKKADLMALLPGE